MRKEGPNPADTHVGARVRMRRLMLGLSQERLADGLGLTFQQVQKYEKGANRIGASRLQQIAVILQVPVSFFFEGLPSTSATTGGGASKNPLASIMAFMATPDGLALAKAFIAIKDRRVRRNIVHLVEQIGSSDE